MAPSTRVVASPLSGSGLRQAERREPFGSLTTTLGGLLPTAEERTGVCTTEVPPVVPDGTSQTDPYCTVPWGPQGGSAP